MKRVYLIKNQNGLVKVGVSKDIKKRFKVIENTSGVPIVKTFYTDMISNCFEIETNFKKKFKSFSKKGEWFEIDFESAKSFIKKQKFEKKIKADNENKVEEFFDKTFEEKNKDLGTKGLNITKKDFLEHFQNQKEIGGEEYADFIKNYPNISKGIFCEEEFLEYKSDIECMYEWL